MSAKSAVKRFVAFIGRLIDLYFPVHFAAVVKAVRTDAVKILEKVGAVNLHDTISFKLLCHYYSTAVVFCQSLILVHKALHKAVKLGRGNIAADKFVFVDYQVAVDVSRFLVTFVIFHLVGVKVAAFSLV